MRPKRQLFFLHVQKTGGATLTGAISQRFALDDALLLYYPPEPDLRDIDSYRYGSGHVPISFVERFAEPPYLFTVLRDPIERALSAYSFLRTRPPQFEGQILLFGRGTDAYDRARVCLRLAREHSIEEFIERAPAIATEYFGNRQARVLGDAPPEGGQERLADALEGLARCDFVGLGERLDESASWLMRRLGWRAITPLPHTNVTTLRLHRDQVSREGIEALEQLTSIDRELYRHGVQRYERQVAGWERLDDHRDPGAEIADAAALRDLRFGDAIQGAGWIGRELVPDEPAACWIGDTRRAWVDLASDRMARSVMIEIAHVLDQAILESLRITVDGRPVPHRLVEGDGIVLAIAPLRRWPFRRHGRATRVTLEVDSTRRPRDVDPASSDDRELAVAVRRIAFERS